jgi:hypothetical protein
MDTGPLPPGCRARYEELLKRSNILLDKFYYGNRSEVKELLSEMEPFTAAAVVAGIIEAAEPTTKEMFQKWIKEAV